MFPVTFFPTTIEFGIQLVGIEEIQNSGQLLVVELFIGQVEPLFMDLHATDDTVMEHEVS